MLHKGRSMSHIERQRRSGPDLRFSRVSNSQDKDSPALPVGGGLRVDLLWGVTPDSDADNHERGWPNNNKIN